MMDDPWPVPPGTVGIILGEDCNGDLEMEWSNGSSLKLIPTVDRWEVLDEEDASFPVRGSAPHHPG